jgi:MATE family multidrug resistance protein
MPVLLSSATERAADHSSGVRTSQAAATLTSRTAGGGSPLEARRASWHAVGLGVVAMLVVAGALVVSGRASIGAILPAGRPDREHVAAIAWQFSS